MENQDSMTPVKITNSTAMDSTESKLVKIPEKECKRIVLRMFSKVKEGTGKWNSYGKHRQLKKIRK